MKARSLKGFFIGVTAQTLAISVFATAARTQVVPEPSVETPVNSEETSQPQPVEPPDSAAEVAEDTPEELPQANPEAVEASPTVPIEVTPILAPTEVEILTPDPDALLSVPATSIILQYSMGAKVELLVNGEVVDPSFIGRTETDPTTNTITQTWYGVSLKEGVNNISAQATHEGVAGQAVGIKVQVPSAPKQLAIETVEARIPADGRSSATVQGQLLDASGNRSNRDAVVTLETSAGEFIGVDSAPDQDGFQVQAQRGEFTATLRSSLDAQMVRIRATTNDLEAFTQITFETNLRPSIVTGVLDFRLGARGTDYYGSFRNFLPADQNNRYQLSAQGNVFAMGRVFEEWLLTAAYNSSRTLNEACNDTSRVFRDVKSCDRDYPVYGDSAKTDILTPSQDSLYLRLERSARIRGADPDYFMWGDYNTNEFATRSQQFTATTRQLHGFKANYNIGNLQLTALYGNNIQGFQRDTIPPDGTSGYYFLSRRLLIPGSENVFLETEEIDRPGTVIERKQLNRTLDYEVDYDRGTLLFRQPILRTDVDPTGRVLVRRIVATYQFESDTRNSIVGGRARYHLSRDLNNESSLGATYLRENQELRNFELYGADALISLGPKTTIIAEYAHSSNHSELMGTVGGSAYRVEAQAELFPGIEATGFYRSAETGFANNATTSFVPGQTRYGAQFTGRVSPSTTVRLQYDRENNRGIAPQPLNNLEDLLTPRFDAVPGHQVDNSLTSIAAGVQQQLGDAMVNVDFINRHREDRLATNPLNLTSNQLRSRLTLPLSSTLTLQAQNELNLSPNADLVYPDRTLFSLSWAALPGINLRLNQIFFSGGQYQNNSITTFDIDGKYKLGSDTTVIGRASLLNGQSLVGSVGLQQGWTISPGLRLDLNYEKVFGDFFNRTGTGVQFPQPFAPGQSASSLGVKSGDSYSVGISYSNNPNFQASARYEHRTSSTGTNTVISTAAAGKLSPAITALFRYQQASTANQTLTGLGATSHLKFGIAYREPNNDKFNALLRYEHRKNPGTIPQTILFGNGTGSEDNVFAVEGIYAPNWRWEFYGKYAIRNSTSYLAQDLVGSSTVSIAQLRATYRLGFNMDLVGEARLISQPVTGYNETGFLIEAGYYLTPNLRLSAGYAFGRVDDRDFSGSRSASGPYIGFTVKLNELFDGFGLQTVPLPQQPESVVEPVAAETQATPEEETPASPTPATEGVAP